MDAQKHGNLENLHIVWYNLVNNRRLLQISRTLVLRSLSTNLWIILLNLVGRTLTESEKKQFKINLLALVSAFNIEVEVGKMFKN